MIDTINYSVPPALVLLRRRKKRKEKREFFFNKTAQKEKKVQYPGEVRSKQNGVGAVEKHHGTVWEVKIGTRSDMAFQNNMADIQAGQERALQSVPDQS